MPFKVSDEFIEENQVVAVLSGGTEAQFVNLVREKKIDLKRPVYLMVSGYSNSLPASLEILSFIRQRQGIAKIMQHPKDTVFPDVNDTESLTRAPLAKVLKNEKKQRLGVVGASSDWLIASQVDYKEVLKQMNTELVDIPFEELSSLGEVDPGMKGAEAIYERLKEIIAKHKLDGVTLRCFDLFKTVKNTGCLAVSKLNDEGIPAGCESDIPVLLTMMACKKLTGEPGSSNTFIIYAVGKKGTCSTKTVVEPPVVKAVDVLGGMGDFIGGTGKVQGELSTGSALIAYSYAWAVDEFDEVWDSAGTVKIITNKTKNKVLEFYPFAHATCDESWHLQLKKNITLEKGYSYQILLNGYDYGTHLEVPVGLQDADDYTMITDKPNSWNTEDGTWESTPYKHCSADQTARQIGRAHV